MQYFGFDRPSFGIKTFGFGANPDDAILALFTGGKQGVWYDPSDKSTLFQDVAGTVPVTKDGDPVALMRDKSGNNNHAIQEIAARRPIYRTDGNLHWLEDDAVDDALYIPNSKSSFKFLHDGSDSAICVATAMMGEDSYRQVIATHSSASANTGAAVLFADRFNISAEDKLLQYQVLRGEAGTIAGNARITRAYTVGERLVLTSKAVGSTVTLFKNKVLLAQGTGVESSTSPSTYDVTLFGIANFGYAKLRIYGVIICNTTELQSAENYLATKAGVAL